MLGKRTLAGLLSAVCLTACGPPAPDDTGLGEQGLLNGQVTPKERLLSALMFYSQQGSSPTPSCTGTAVGPRHILTAAHCVIDFAGSDLTPFVQAQYQPGKVFYYANEKSLSASAVPGYVGIIEEVALHPGFTTACAGNCATGKVLADSIPDLALITLTSPFTAQLAHAAVDTQPVASGQKVTVSGYGCENTDMRAPSTVRLKSGVSKTLSVAEASAVVTNQPIPTSSALFGTAYLLTPSIAFGNQVSHVTPGLCPGDSGGPLYRGAPAFLEKERVIGVNSMFYSEVGDPQINYHARTQGTRTVSWLKKLLPAGSFL
jgi:hypothetical protein